MASASHVDDPTILDASELWRRISPKHIIWDDNRGLWRPSSASFTNSRDGSPMSVLLADVLGEMGRGPATVLAGHQDYGLASVTAGLARECLQGVARDPLPEEQAHGVVFGDKTNRVRRTLAEGSRWVVLPLRGQIPAGSSR